MHTGQSARQSSLSSMLPGNCAIMVRTTITTKRSKLSDIVMYAKPSTLSWRIKKLRPPKQQCWDVLLSGRRDNRFSMDSEAIYSKEQYRYVANACSISVLLFFVRRNCLMRAVQNRDF